MIVSRMIPCRVLLVLGMLAGAGPSTTLAADSGFVRFDLEVTVAHSEGVGGASAGASAGAAQKKTAYLLLIDHSGSMNSQDGRAARQTRWDCLKASLRETLDSLPVGCDVSVILFSDDVQVIPWDKGRDTITIGGQADCARIRARIEDFGKPDGRTVLYDALGRACEIAGDLVRKGRSVHVVVFSDGKDEGSKLTDDNSQKGLRAQFRALFENPSFKVCPVWINPSTPPASTLADRYAWQLSGAQPRMVFVNVSPTTITTPNPFVGGAQRVSIRYDFQTPREAWAAIEGKMSTLAVDFGEGKAGAADRTRSRVLVLRPGVTNIAVEIPRAQFPVDRDFTNTVRLLNMPNVPNVTIAAPGEMRVVFSKPGVLPVTGMLPPSGTTVRVGDTVEFSLQTLPGATCSWSFGDGASAGGTAAQHAYAGAKRYIFKATVSMPGLMANEKSGEIEVVDVGVALDPFAAGAAVGVPYEMKCRGRGPIARYEWLIDGSSYPGEDATDRASSRIRYTFVKSGEHKVYVRAIPSSMPPVPSEERKVTVEEAPFIRITSLKGGDEFHADSKIDLAASVEGGIPAVTWRASGKDGKSQHEESSQVAGGVAAAVMKIPKGGEYTITASGSVAGKTVSSAGITIHVAPPDIRTDIVSPVADQRLETGREYTFAAKVLGPIKQVKWFAKDIDSGRREELGVSPVGADNRCEKAVRFRPEDGDRGLRVEAEGLAALADAEPAKAEPIPISVFTPGSIDIEQPANYEKVPFGKDMVFKARTGGLADDVTWYLEEGSKAVEMGKTRSLSYSFVQAGRREALTAVYATASLPGGRTIRSQPVVVHAVCPSLSPVLRLPTTGGVEQISYRLRERIEMNLAAGGAGAKTVAWTFGDGASATGEETSASHVYTNYGHYVVSAVAVCRACGATEDAHRTLQIVSSPPVPAFAICQGSKPVGGWVGKGSLLSLVCQSSGDVGGRAWACNDQAIPGSDGKTNVDFVCSRRGTQRFRLAVTDAAGSPSPAPPAEHAVRVINSALIVLMAVVAVVLYGFVFWTLCGDDPMYWRVYGVKAPSPDATIKDIKFVSPIPLKTFWSVIHNEAHIPMSKLFPRSPHWTGGKGKEDVLRIVARKASDGLVPQVSSSATGQVVQFTEMEPNKTYRLKDARAFTPGRNREEPVWDEFATVWIHVRKTIPGSKHLWIKLLSFLLILGLFAALCRFMAF